MKTLNKQHVFEYLDELRESGVTNMFGATAYVQREFRCEREPAKELLLEWMRTFSERHPRTPTQITGKE